MTRLLSVLALLAACATPDNRSILEELGREAARNPDKELLARVVDPSPYHIQGARRRGQINPRVLWYVTHMPANAARRFSQNAYSTGLRTKQAQ